MVFPVFNSAQYLPDQVSHIASLPIFTAQLGITLITRLSTLAEPLGRSSYMGLQRCRMILVSIASKISIQA